MLTYELTATAPAEDLVAAAEAACVVLMAAQDDLAIARSMYCGEVLGSFRRDVAAARRAFRLACDLAVAAGA